MSGGHRRSGWVALTVGAAAVAALGAIFAGAQPDDERRGTDPLSATEEEAAIDAAVAALPDTGPESAGPAETVTLLVERHDEGKDAPDDLRRADVHVYDYATDTLTSAIVDLGTGTVDDVRTARRAQPPLVASEEERALQVALDDPTLLEALRAAYQRATGRALTDPAAEVEAQPIVFIDRATDCGRHRCAQLMLKSSDDLLIDLLPIVDLSAERVVSVDGFFR